LYFKGKRNPRYQKRIKAKAAPNRLGRKREATTGRVTRKREVTKRRVAKTISQVLGAAIEGKR
jgi:hypothetical protein